ncbi:phage portal protein [Abyssicoccus albus]|uniref:phage portal protein n=1 Tax=Abyssicoccus albus TaxID=1817405 RepID=UPI00097E2847|nr:phage portal protein [Abyssicoccus albus]AQL56421.1 phage portal protein [Abyssicoccus albus]
MGLFYSGKPHNEEEMEFLVSTLPGFVGIGHHEYSTVEALRNSDIFTAVMMIASDMAKMNIHVMKDDMRDKNHVIEKLFNKRPNDLYDAYTFKFVVIANALLTKHGYIEIVRNSKGQPEKLYHIKSSELEVVKKNNKVFYLHKNKREIEYNDVIDFKPYSLDGIDSISMLQSLTPDLEMQKHSKSFFANFFKHGTQAGGKLKLKDGQLSKEAREKLREEFQKANSGADNAGKVLVLDETMEYDKFEIDTEILKLINTSQHSTAQVAKVFGIPLHKFGIANANMSLKDSINDYLQTTLSRYMKAFVSACEFKLLQTTTYSLVFDTKSYRKVDWEVYTKIISEQYNDGVISLNEYRLELGYPPINEPYAEKHRVSLNQVNAELVDEYQKARADNRLKGGDNDE